MFIGNEVIIEWLRTYTRSTGTCEAL